MTAVLNTYSYVTVCDFPSTYWSKFICMFVHAYFLYKILFVRHSVKIYFWRVRPSETPEDTASICLAEAYQFRLVLKEQRIILWVLWGNQRLGVIKANI